HVVRDVLHAVLAQHRAPGRHYAVAASGDRRLDLRRLAAPEPVLVREVREAARAARIRGMALRAVVEEELLPHGERRRVAREILDLEGGELLVERAVLLLGLLRLLPELAHLGPAEHALPAAAQARVEHEVDGAEDDRQVEEPAPPGRQRVVVFAEVLVPDVAGRIGGCRGLALGLRPQQHGARGNRHRGQDRDVDVPEAGGEIAHSSSPRRPWPSKRRLREGEYAQQTIATKVAKTMAVITASSSPRCRAPGGRR